MDWLLSLIPAPHTRLPITLQSLTSLGVPPILCYYLTAILVLIPGSTSFLARLALLPLTLWTCFRASTKLDFAKQFEDERLAYLNHGLLLVMSTVAFRSLVWSFEKEPYYRVPRSQNVASDSTPSSSLSSRASSPAPSSSSTPKSTPKPSHSRPRSPPNTLSSLEWKPLLTDAFDLIGNLRGLGWNWSSRLFIPPETRPLDSRSAFLRPTFLSLITTVVFFDFNHWLIQLLDASQSTFSSAHGGTIFDSSFPPLYRYSKSTLVTFLTGLEVVTGIHQGYLFFTLLCVGVLRQDPSDWPPEFDAPWLSTSLNEFWTRRWHQSFRDIFIGAGSKPLNYLMGKPGLVLGAFGISGILHVFGLWGMGRGTEWWSVAGYFVMMGVGIVLEHVYKAITGRRVGGGRSSHSHSSSASKKRGKKQNGTSSNKANGSDASALWKERRTQDERRWDLEAWLGWAWTMFWVVSWGNFLVDAWFRKGLGGSRFFPSGWRPVEVVFWVFQLAQGRR